MESMGTGLSPNAHGHFPSIHLRRMLVVVAAQGRNTSVFVSFKLRVLPMWDSNMQYILTRQSNLSGSLASS